MAAKKEASAMLLRERHLSPAAMVAAAGAQPATRE